MPVSLDISNDFLRRITESIELRPFETPDNNPTQFHQVPKTSSNPKNKFQKGKLQMSSNFIGRITQSIDLYPIISDKTVNKIDIKSDITPEENKNTIENTRSPVNFCIRPTDILFTSLKPRFIYNNSSFIDSA